MLKKLMGFQSNRNVIKWREGLVWSEAGRLKARKAVT
jgi:hypothetical protein